MGVDLLWSDFPCAVSGWIHRALADEINAQQRISGTPDSGLFADAVEHDS